MKKLMIAVAAIACATVGFAEDTAITSANIVGFNQVTIKGGKWNMFAVNYQKVGDSATTNISIQDLIPGTTEGLQGGTAKTGDQIQIYNATTGDYDIFFLFKTAVPIPSEQAKNYKWFSATNTAAAATYTFKNGDAFWYRSKGTTDVTVSLLGGVSLAASQTIDIVNGWNMIGSAFPANFNPNSLGKEYWQNSGAFGGTATTGDQMQIYNSATGDYDIYFLYKTAVPVPTEQAKNYQWFSATNTAAPIATSVEVLSAGKGAWYRHKGTGFTLTIPTPLGE